MFADLVDSGDVSSNKMAVRLVRVHRNGFGDRVRRAIIDQTFVVVSRKDERVADGLATHPTTEN